MFAIEYELLYQLINCLLPRCLLWVQGKTRGRGTGLSVKRHTRRSCGRWILPWLVQGWLTLVGTWHLVPSTRLLVIGTTSSVRSCWGWIWPWYLIRWWPVWWRCTPKRQSCWNRWPSQDDICHDSPTHWTTLCIFTRVQFVTCFRVSVSDSKDVLGRPPKTHSYPCSEGLQNVQESAYDMMFLGALLMKVML